MNDADPRPMPPEVQQAYRETIDLRGLLMSSVYDQKDRQGVLDTLMRSLIAKYGDVWIMAGRNEVRVSTRVKQFKKDAAKAVELLSSIGEYGESYGVLPLLAQAMQPRWAAWWQGFKWIDADDIQQWRTVIGYVFGKRQIVWLAAQYARLMIDSTLPHEREACLAAIEASEAWARVPSEENRRAAARAADAVNSVISDDEDEDDWADQDDDSWDASTSAWRAADAAISADAGYQTLAAAQNAIATDSLSGSAVKRAGRGARYTRIETLTKRLITPTLVTSASSGMGKRGLRAR